jgi:hypothetical protein
MSPRYQPLKAVSQHKLSFNADAAAIVIALLFAALVRFNVIPHITW